MDSALWLDAVAENAGRLAAVARQAGLEAPVPTCPPWTVADLVAHMGGVVRFVGGVIEQRAQSFPGFPEIRVDETDPVGWFEAGAERLLGLLRSVGEDDLVWNWAGAPGPATFWHRRMAHEHVIHRADAEAAAGIGSVVEPPELAADGIDEYLTMLSFLPQRRTAIFEGMEASYHLHATDTPGEWMLTFGGGQLRLAREHGKGDVAVRGPAGALELLIYNRGHLDGLEVYGDAGLLDLWRERIRL